MNDDEIPSPCISVCVLDENDICQGCYRSAVEIADWFMSSTEDKREVLRRCRERMSEAGGFKLI
jgi:predicted Fe-S protein YdhL (DUF1289 family)